MSAEGRCAGFTLLELLVAFTVLGLGLGLLLRISFTGLAGTLNAGEYHQASALAQSQLARVGTEIPLQGGTHAGTWREDYRWRIRIARAEDLSLPRAPLRPYRVGVKVRWARDGSERSFRLQTLRLRSGVSEGNGE